MTGRQIAPPGTRCRTYTTWQPGAVRGCGCGRRGELWGESACGLQDAGSKGGGEGGEARLVLLAEQTWVKSRAELRSFGDGQFSLHVSATNYILK